MSMPIQFAFNNPKRGRVKGRKSKGKKARKAKKGLVKRKKASKLKNVRHISKSRRAKVGSRKKVRKSRRNPTLVATKARPGHRRGYKDINTFPDKKDVVKLSKKADEARKKYDELPPTAASARKKTLRIKLAKALKEYKASEEAFRSGLKTLAEHKASGYKISSASKVKPKRKKKKSVNAAKGGSVAKKRKAKKVRKSGKRRSKAQKAALKKMLAANKARRKGKKAGKKSRKPAKRAGKKAGKKHTRKTARKASRKAKRKYAKRYSHSHSRRVRHVPKGTVFTGRGRAKIGKRKLTGIFRFKTNPFGGKMTAKVKEFTGHELEELGSLAVGGALFGALNNAWYKYVPANIVSMMAALPGNSVWGPAFAPILVGSLLHKYGGKVPYAQLVGEGLVAAAVVGMGVSAAGALQIPGLSGIDYTPNMSGVQYTPGLAGVSYTPNMGVMPQLGRGADFGRAADYGGGGGYTQDHKFSRADFGAEDDSDSEYVGLGGVAESQMG